MLRGHARDDGAEARLEPEVEDAVGLVDDEHLQVGRVEADGLIEVLQQSTRRAHEQVHPGDPLRLLSLVLAADDQAGRQLVLLAWLRSGLGLGLGVRVRGRGWGWGRVRVRARVARL